MYRSTPGLVKVAHGNAAPDALLSLPVTALLGVTDEAARVLRNFGLTSVFDLASSRLFGTAHDVGSAATASSSLAPLRVVPSDMIDAAYRHQSAAELASADVAVLRMIGAQNRDPLVAALNVDTVHDLGAWPPYRAARAILNEAYGRPAEGVTDPDAPPELLPVGRRYATESRRYPKLFLDHLDTGDGLDLTELGDARQLDVSDVDADRGFTRPATGALLIFEQLWVPEGLSLGQLASSVALAPGESTKIAVIDWSRRVASAVTEDVEERDRITASLAQTRAISEIQDSVASEHTAGQSQQETTSTTTASATASGGGVEDLVGGAVEVFRRISPVLSTIDALTGRKRREHRGSTSESDSTTTGSTLTVSSSSGQRSVSAQSQQDIMASTRQASSSVRSRRASSVQEVTQTESEELRTRVLANYNHSHALSIHYYEVVQIYRTLLRLAKWHRVLFIPMKVLDFSNPLVISRHKQALLGAVRSAFVRRQLASFVDKVTFNQVNSGSATRQVFEFDEDLEVRFAAAAHRSGPRRDLSIVFTLRGGRVVTVPVDLGAGLVRLPTPVTLGEIERVSIQHGSYAGDLVAIVRLGLFLAQPGVTRVKSAINIETALQPARDATDCLLGNSPDVDPTVFDYLREHSLELSQAVWRALDQQQLALLISRYAFKGEPLVEVVDLQVLTVFGNYLALPYHPRNDASDSAWKAWQRQHVDESRVDEELVPVPTDGLFAEAVLGRFNASEKLDISRFWDWQESPIPLQAPDIGPLQAGQHQAAAATMPGQLSAPLIGMQAPAALPAPTGLGPMLNTLQADLFRDMSGLQETAATMRDSTATSSEASQNAARLANEIERMKQETIGRLTEMVARAGIAAAGAAAGGPAGGVIAGPLSGAVGASGGGGGATLSPQSGASNALRGAMLNYGRSTDAQTPRSGAGAAGGPEQHSASSPLASSPLPGTGQPRPSAGGAALSREDQAFNSIVGYPPPGAGDVQLASTVPDLKTFREEWTRLYFAHESHAVDSASEEFQAVLAKVIDEARTFTRRWSGRVPVVLLVRGLASRERRSANFDNDALSRQRAEALATALAEGVRGVDGLDRVLISPVAGGIGTETFEANYWRDRRAEVIHVWKAQRFQVVVDRPIPPDEVVKRIVLEKIQAGDALMLQAEQDAALDLIGDTALKEAEGLVGPQTPVGQLISLAITVATSDLLASSEEIEMRQYRRIYRRYLELRGGTDTL